jgi:hypothetical protein
MRIVAGVELIRAVIPVFISFISLAAPAAAGH